MAGRRVFVECAAASGCDSKCRAAFCRSVRFSVLGRRRIIGDKQPRKLSGLRSSGVPQSGINYAVKSRYLPSFLESVPDVASKLKEPSALLC